MSDSETNPLITRLENVERTISELSRRIQRVEQLVLGGTQPEQVVVAPPPILPIHREIPVANVVAAWESFGREPVVPKPMPTAKSEKQLDDLEYKIGLTGLLRGGAIVIVIAIIYLVALAVSKGYITPVVQFSGEIALCLAFVGLGFIKRNEKEEFGQLMVGIGSCGLYLSFAGAHLFKHLYSGETLVVLFVCLSFINFAFSHLKSSRSFLAIGMMGGFTAAMLPMSRYNATLDISLHFLILVPCALLVVKNKWLEMSMLLFVAAMAALIPAMTYNHDWPVRLGGLYGTSLITALVYSLVWKETEFDPWGMLSGVFLVIGGVAALAFDETAHGSLHVLLLSGPAAVVGYLLTAKPGARNAFWLAGLSLSTALTPVGFHRLEAGFAYAGFSILLGIAALRFAPKALAGLSALNLSLGLVAYTTPWSTSNFHFTVATESWLLVSFMVATVVGGFAIKRVGGASQNAMLVASIIALPLFSRFGFVLLSTPTFGYPASLALVVSFFVFSAGLFAVSKQTHWRMVLVLAWVTFLGALLQYSQLIFDGFPAPAFDTVILALLIGMTCFAGVTTRINTESDSEANVLSAVGAVMACLIVRLSVLWLTLPAIALNVPCAIVIGLLLVTALSGGLASRLVWTALVPQGWLALLFGGAGALTIQLYQRTPSTIETGLLACSMACILLMASATGPRLCKKETLVSFCIFYTWVLFSRFAYLLFTSKGIGLKDGPAVTMAWIVYAIALLALGFQFRLRNMRYWSFGVFGATLVKVFLYDLSSLDPGVRVLILLLLGIGMVGGGYWYIRMHSANALLPEDKGTDLPLE